MPLREAGPRVFDCFTFMDELVLLRARLELLKDVVHRFVIVEGDQTYQGSRRDLVLDRTDPILARMWDRITYIPVTDFPDTHDAWVREGFQRDAILRGLGDARPDDLILISDVDEIPRPEIVESLRECLTTPVALGLHLGYYRVNLRSAEPWTRSGAVRYRDLETPQRFRERRDLPVIEDAGWHLSYLGPTEAIVRKLAAFAHTEFSGPRWNSERHIRRSVRLGVRLFGGVTFEVVPDEECIPTISRAAHPELFQPRPTARRRLWARGYVILARHRGRIPLWLADRLPGVAVVVAVALHFRALLVQRLRWRRA
jgi:beta-1,4-mannosyl-glycoprotein beta-1,4-N-acetylglucosaminyltransferase